MRVFSIIIVVCFVVLLLAYLVLTDGGKASLFGAIIGKILIKKSIPKEHNVYGTRQEVLDKNKELYEKDWKPEEGYVLTTETFDHYIAEVLQPIDGNNGKAVLQLHGGGFLLGLQPLYRDFAQKYCKILRGGLTLTPNYRTAYEAPFPAALYDCVESYQWLLQKGYLPENIVIAGDSSGANLVLTTILFLKEHNIPLPGKAITMSPITDFHFDTKSCKKNSKICVIGNNFGAGIFKPEIFPYFENQKIDLSNPYISPYFGDYKGFPPILMQVGNREVLRDDTVKVAEKIKASGGSVKMTIYSSMFHVFQCVDKMKESKWAWKEVEDFLLIAEPSKMIKHESNRK